MEQAHPIIIIDIKNLIDQFEGQFQTITAFNNTIQNELSKLNKSIGTVPHVIVMDD